MSRFAIINGDDFGLSPGINRGVLEAHHEGILTSASLMAMGEAFEEAVVLGRENPGLSLGVHLTLVEGVPVLPPEKIPSLVTASGRFVGSVRVFLRRWLAGQIRQEEIQHEFEAQVEKVLAHGVHIDKLDSHMHLHLLPGILRIVLALRQRYRISGIRLAREGGFGWSRLDSAPGRIKRLLLTSLSRLQAWRIAPADLVCPDHFSGTGQSGRLTEEGLLRILERLKPGVTEIMVHPGYRDSVLDGWPKSSRYEREQELRALTSPRVKELVRSLQIGLVSYRAVLEGRVVP